MTAFDDLMAHQRETEALGQIAGRLSWDQETVMPRGSADQRAEEMGVMEGLLHARRTDPRIGEWLDKAQAPDAAGEASLRLIRRSFERTARVPARLATELARVTSKAQGQWAEARAADDFAAFAPVLAQVVALKREEAAALADGGDLYDALLDDYEPGATAKSLSAMFDALRPRLMALRDRALGAPTPPSALPGTFDPKVQMHLTRKLAIAFGYDMNRGRIDRAVHPFSSGSGRDVRITTRTDPADPFNCLYSTIHEVGHATYEQNIDDAYLFTPLGGGVSMGVHESQSRIYENQLARSEPFCGWLFGQMTEAFGDLGVSEREFFRTVNRLHKGFIRTESDEVQYNLHVLLRFDLERSMIAGDLDPADLEGAWNERFEADFGYRPERASQGCLQDVHWSVGLFGYFPTYTLGNVYAGCLNAAMRADLPDLDAALANGDPSPATAWLRDKVQVHGGLYQPREVITRACGFEPSEAPLLDYLEAKFGAIYG
ncbi:Thermostable carboxypeptidase 1 [Rhodobacteraceae bacterium THAF1]|uniref:carboxypeptidase M32 n=1 Tax=Palleronia sp. THAF1 TaxID=2587842 RepID=UPI000F4162FB|nr:carboxypeptidase M32 [Palleronia sp. THAF1]QFU08490.1 Thermostable carboxypeptidase 1 [Palleronia sp. THAF1]VDC29448.1 Thermostable carboxypeptidase 1 [Rhodobacteraceae bacterium THAF1]